MTTHTLTQFASQIQTLAVPSDGAGRRKAVAAQIQTATAVAGYSARAVLAAAAESLAVEAATLEARRRAGEEVKAELALVRGRLGLVGDAHAQLVGAGMFSRTRELTSSLALYRAERAALERGQQVEDLRQTVEHLGDRMTAAVEEAASAASSAALAAASAAAAVAAAVAPKP